MKVHFSSIPCEQHGTHRSPLLHWQRCWSWRIKFHYVVVDQHPFIKNFTRSRNHCGTRVGIACWNSHLKLNLCWFGIKTHIHTICFPIDKRDEIVSRWNPLLFKCDVTSTQTTSGHSLNSLNAGLQVHATAMKRASVLVKLRSHLSSCIVSAKQAIPGRSWISVYTIFPEKSFAVATAIVSLNGVETVPELGRVVTALTVNFSDVLKYSSTGTSDKDTNDMSPDSEKLSIISSISSLGDKRWPFPRLLR